MNLHKKIDLHTTLYYVEPNVVKEDDIVSYQLSFRFYDHQYYVYVTKENIDNDNEVMSMIEGDSRLFESFEEYCEGELWPKIKAACRLCNKYYQKIWNDSP